MAAQHTAELQERERQLGKQVQYWVLLAVGSIIPLIGLHSDTQLYLSKQTKLMCSA